MTGADESGAENGRAIHRAPCDAVEHMSPTANMEGLERRVCPVCRLYFDVGETSDLAFCSRACERRYRRGEVL